ncbi:hypothetical protein BH09ACT1_BH09ACT1_12490 [soil metagenome]
MTDPESPTTAAPQTAPLHHRVLSRGRVLLGGGVLAVVVIAVSAFVMVSQGVNGGSLTLGAQLTASSSQVGHGPDALVDDSSATSQSLNEWRPSSGTTGTWVTLTWASATKVAAVTVVRSSAADRKIAAGVLTFSDGSSVLVNFADGQNVAKLSITPRTVTSATFTVTTLASGATSAAVAELHVAATSAAAVSKDTASNGNAAAAATVTASTTGTGSSAANVIDTPKPTKYSDIGKQWITTGAQSGSWVQLTWAAARELSSVRLMGTSGLASTVTAGHLLFSDGSTLAVGALESGAKQPTTVAFLPRSVTSVRFVVDTATGSGAVGVGEFSAYDTGTTPPSFTTFTSTALKTATTQTCNPGATAVSGSIVVSCPATNTSVDGTTKITVYALGLAKVDARVWGSTYNANANSGAAVTATPAAGTGLAVLTIDARSASRGPFTVKLQGYSSTSASAVPLDSATTYLELFNTKDSAPSTSPTVPSTSTTGPSAGMTLAYDDEFTSPVTTTATGAGADYASSKPTYSGADGFGDAIFADPSLGYKNLLVVDNNYLRITASAKPSGYLASDSRKYIGGMLASGHVGGSGFSAQYGYFEARMYAPQGKGTWPAFWMLPTPNLVTAQKTVTEVDATEIYGHNPVATCSSVHNYVNSVDTKTTLCDTRYPSVQAALAWHTYGVRVSPTTITYYVDGAKIASIPQVSGGADPMFLMVNMAMGGGWPDDISTVGNTASLYVDYVRAYS